ncbi:MAG: hypothetical protein ACOX7P_08745 [Oscillospiraceae bacterium]
MRKLIAPIIIAVLISAIYIAYIVLCFILDFSIWIKIAALCIGLALVGVAIFVLVERIIEVRSGDLDDLGKY